jgi:hypothetical protein
MFAWLPELRVRALILEITMFVAETERTHDCTHILLITTGSVASVKVPLIVEELLHVRLTHFRDHNMM